MRQKEKALLSFLIKHNGEYVTSGDLASKLSLSDRTVRNYLQDLKPLVEDNGGKIIAKQGRGYQLTIIHKMAFDLFLNQENMVSNLHKKTVGFSEVEERQKYILNRLLLEERVIFIDDLAEELFISRSSLTKDIQDIKDKLKLYSLKIVSKHGKGFWVEGEERNKRHFIMDTLFGKTYANSMKDYLGNSQFFKEISLEELTIIILDETREAHLKVSDFIIQNLVLHLSLGIKRMKEGFEIKDLGIQKDLFESLEYQVAKKIVKRIEMMANVIFPVEEISYLIVHLMAKSNHEANESNQELLKELDTAIEKISQALGYSLADDLQLKNGLLDHLGPLLVRSNRGISLENPLTEEIKAENPRIFQLTKKHFSEMPKLRQFNISDDEWAYLALHLLAALEKLKDSYKIRALIICATGFGSAQLLKNRVVNEFGKHITIANVKGYYEINDSLLKGVDLIISSVDLSTMVFKIPVLHVSVFLNDTDVHRIRKTLDQLSSNESPIEATQFLNFHKKQKYYANYLTRNFFKTYTVMPTKDSVIDDLLALLSVNEEEDYSKKMKQQILQRETMGQIIFSETVAVPHPALPIGVSTKIAVALIPDGMEWEDNKNIKFVFLISPSYIENEGITVVTKAIVQLVDQLTVQDQILSDPTFENFNEQFIQII
ncbi:BglG family transcription antiterminator [Enterococcus devriesei]|uniref:BglG family transcription antiterminator n=1 Tax=Enterococcus devriesei TaxID=319970 RepID=UPI0028A905DE|nr:BglG family transcription antiterminator [Enterococcus devriesei]